MNAYERLLQSRAADRILAIRAAGEPVTLADLARPPIPPEQNAVTYLRFVESELNELCDELNKPYDQWADRLGPRSEDAAFDIHLGMWPPPELRRHLAECFAESPRVVPHLEQAVNCPDFGCDYDCTLAPEQFFAAYFELLPTLRNALRILSGWAMFQAASGMPDFGLNTCSLMLRLCERANAEPLLVAELARIGLRGVVLACANRILQRCATSACGRASLRRAILEIDPWPTFEHTILTERAYSLTEIALAAQDAKDLDHDLSAALDKTDAQLAVTRAGTCNALDNAALAIACGAMAPISDDHFWATRNLLLQQIARTRCLLVLLAIHDRRELHGDADFGIGQLGLDDAAVSDPISGGKLKMTREANGWRVFAGDWDDGVGFGPEKDIAYS